QWYHISVTQQGTSYVLYVNGIAVKSSNASSINTTDVCDGIGSFSSDKFDGSIDDVRVYNYARTPAQIAWDYNRGGPVGLWKFDECTGSTAYDLSGQGNNGTINIGGSGSQTTAGNCVTTDAAAAWYNGKDGKYNSSLNFDGSDDVV